ncbi:MAG TPA: molybdenum cofactor guanylyltransferase [Williamwhitmania sp.]|nr:molybdenum cofactor guanylyltransferase [Williamwhitmania sp.]
MNVKQVTGIILAGGKSSRFGVDKGLFPYLGKPMVEYAINLLRPLCAELLIITNNPKDYTFTGLKLVEDLHKGLGPLAGIHSGLLASRNSYNLVIGCDLPELHSDLFRVLLNHKEGHQVVMPIHNGLKESMASYFHRSSIPIVEEALHNNRLKIFDAIVPLKTLFLDVVGMPFYSENLFTNINTKADINFHKRIGE